MDSAVRKDRAASARFNVASLFVRAETAPDLLPLQCSSSE